MNILVCDDDRDLVGALRIYLTNEGYEVLCAFDGRQALDLLRTQTVHLLIIDIMMPVLDGLNTILELRRTQSLPVILLSAKGEDADKILGLNLGADDYVTKPFNPAELMARVRSHLRRYTQLGSQVAAGEDVYRVGGLELDDKAKQVKVEGEPARLTPVEYKILLLLMRHPGQVFSTEQIYEQVWGMDAMGADNTVAVHVRRIREKIELNPKDPKYLKVVWGVGYKIEKQE